MQQQKLLFEQVVLLKQGNIWKPGISISLSFICTNSGLQNLYSDKPPKQEEINPWNNSVCLSPLSALALRDISYRHTSISSKWLQIAVFTCVLGSMAFCSIVREGGITSDPLPDFQCQPRWGSPLHLPLSLIVTRTWTKQAEWRKKSKRKNGQYRGGKVLCFLSFFILLCWLVLSRNGQNQVQTKFKAPKETFFLPREPENLCAKQCREKSLVFALVFPQCS